VSESPWLSTSLADYEAHMSLPQVGQAQLLAGLVGEFAAAARPGSFALAGCAGGNGLDRLDPSVTRRVAAIDLNPQFVAATAGRFASRFERFESLVGAIPDPAIAFPPVAMLFAGLLFEYVEIEPALAWMFARLEAEGLLVTALQLPNPSMPSVTPSPYTSLESLAPVFAYRSATALRDAALALGAVETHSSIRRASGGKDFAIQAFRAPASPERKESR
jgi:hypothetical protein